MRVNGTAFVAETLVTWVIPAAFRFTNDAALNNAVELLLLLLLAASVCKNRRRTASLNNLVPEEQDRQVPETEYELTSEKDREYAKFLFLLIGG